MYIIRLQKITGRRKSLWHAVIIWTMKAMATSSYCLITKEKTASKSIRTISKIIIERRLHISALTVCYTARIMAVC